MKRFALFSPRIKMLPILAVVLLVITSQTPSATSQSGGGAPPALPTGNSGIAAAYPNDIGITANPAVLFADGFESYTSASQLTGSGNYDNYFQQANVTLDTSMFFGGTKSLRLRMPQTASEVGNTLMKNISPARDVLYMRVHVRYQPNYAGIRDAHNGLGISGKYVGPGIRPDGMGVSNGFIVVIEDSRYQSEAEPGYTNAYVYHPEQDDLYGEHWYPDGSVGNGVQNFGPTFVVRPKIVPARGQWISYETLVQLNTPGSRDGRVAVWQDGILIADWQNLRFRDTSTLKIEKIDISNGGKSSTQQNDKWYDNLVLATSYIGPVSTVSLPPDTTLPTVSMTAPANGAFLPSATATVTATAADNVGIVGVQFTLDGANLGAEDTASPFSASWNTSTATNGPHTLAAVARDAAGNTKTSTAVTVTIDKTAPSVSISVVQ